MTIAILVYVFAGTFVVGWILCSQRRRNWNIMVWMADGGQHFLPKDIFTWQAHVDNGKAEITKPGTSTQKVHLRAEGWLWMMVMVTVALLAWPMAVIVVGIRRMRTA